MNNTVQFGFIALQFLLFILNYRWMNRRILHPAVIFSFLWFFILLLHLFFKLTILDELYEISPYTLIVIFAGTLSFTAGSIIISILRERRQQRADPGAYIAPGWLLSLSPNLQTALLMIVVLFFPLYAYKCYQLFLVSNLDNFLVGLRTELSYGEGDIGPVKYLTSFSVFVLATQQFFYYRRRDRQSKIYFGVSLFFALLVTLLTTGRGPILWVFCILLGINYIHGKRFALRSIVLVIAVFLVIFSVVGLLLRKGGNLNATVRDNVAESTEVTATYFVASINAFDMSLQNSSLPDYTGNHSLRFFKVLGKSFGFLPHQEIPELVQLFVFVPYSTNVYTIYNTYYADFGIYYALFILALIGIVQTILYHKALETKNIRYSIYFSMSLYPLFVSFFQDMYFSVLSTWIQIIVFTEVYILINRFIAERSSRKVGVTSM